MLTSIAPILAVAYWVMTHSSSLGAHIPTLSPAFIPRANKPAAKSSVYKGEENNNKKSNVKISDIVHVKPFAIFYIPLYMIDLWTSKSVSDRSPGP